MRAEGSPSPQCVWRGGTLGKLSRWEPPSVLSEVCGDVLGEKNPSVVLSIFVEFLNPPIAIELSRVFSVEKALRTARLCSSDAGVAARPEDTDNGTVLALATPLDGNACVLG